MAVFVVLVVVVVAAAATAWGQSRAAVVQAAVVQAAGVVTEVARVIAAELLLFLCPFDEFGSMEINYCSLHYIFYFYILLLGVS